MATATGKRWCTESRPFAEWERFCQQGVNAGKPGVCPKGGGATAPAVMGNPITGSAGTGRVAALAKKLGVRAASAKETAARFGKAVWAKIPLRDQDKLAAAYGFGKKVEHLAMIGFTRSRQLALEVARQRGKSEQHVDRVAKVLAIVDLSLAWTVNMPATLAVTGSFTAAKVSSWVPVASLFYLAASGARNPYALWDAAKKVFGRKPGPAKPPPRGASKRPGVEELPARHAEGGGRKPAVVKHFEAVSALFDAFDRARDPDWFEALLYAALDRTRDLAKAVKMAEGKAGDGLGAESFREGGNPLRRVKIFSEGVHRGKRYGPGDLRDMVRNFDANSRGPSARLPVPAVLGHEENQEWLERSDLPAAAWPDRIYREGKFLLADFADPPPVVKKLIENQAYRTCSAEVYDEPPDGIPGKGRMLRRIAFLGGDIPELKTLGDIAALTEHSESAPGRRFAPYLRHTFKFREVRPRRSAPGVFFVFAEVRPLDPEKEELDPAGGGGGADPDAMMGQLADLGIDTSVLEGLSPEGLAEILRACDELKSAGGESEYDEDPEEEADEETKEKYRERAQKLAERLSAYRSYCDEEDMKKMAEDFGMPEGNRLAEDESVNALTPETRTPKKVTRTEHYSEKRLAEIVRRELAALRRDEESDLKEARKFREETRAAERKRAALAVVERLGAEGRVSPAEQPLVLARLLRADSKVVVEKFAEVRAGKKVVTDATEFDLQVKELEARPRFFHERARSAERSAAGGGKPGKAEADEETEAEAEKVGQGYEIFRENFPRGYTREAFVEGFKAERKHDPKLTAEKFLNR